MPLAPGTVLGAFQITGQLGVGGMGEVYRATDTKLGRDVAIKTLPEALATDADRLARFEREAKLLASLNHAHIASVYGLDEHDGTRFIAMELVEGESLEDKLKAGALPVEEALELGLQIANALEVAHGKGVVHRDLKPANIMITPDGVVKVLDFGLAKAFSGDPNAASPAHSPALSIAMTQQGLILGTAGYMSPEQASGQATDQRADIWAFGVVLYEMLTGLPPFRGESVPHVLAAVLQTEPDWNRLPKNFHPRLKLLLERCLRKKPRMRYHSMADVRVDLEDILSDPAAATAALESPTTVAPRTSALRLVAAFMFGGVLLGLAAWWFKPLPEPPPRPVVRFSYRLPEGQTWRRVFAAPIAISPDGQNFVYNTEDGLYVRALGELEAHRIAGTEEDLQNPFYSPDGQSIGYYAGRRLKRIALSGGASLPITDDISEPYGASWSPDGTIFFGQPDGIYRIAANGGTPELVIRAEEGERLYGPEVLPDGDTVLFSTTNADNRDEAQIFVQSLATQKRTRLVSGGSDAHYLTTGHLVYTFGDELFGRAFDAATLAVAGQPVSLVQGVRRGAFESAAAAAYAISGDGALVYLGGEEVTNREHVWVYRDGKEESLGFGQCECLAAKLSPDGTRLALHVSSRPGTTSTDVYVWSLAEHNRTRVSFERGLQVRPLWTPNSNRLVYTSRNSDSDGLFLRSADGTGDPELLLESPLAVAWAWVGDDELIFSENTGRAGWDIGIIAVTGDRKPRQLIATGFNEDRPALSPDGRWLAYESDKTGRPEVYVVPFPDVTSSEQKVSSGGGQEPLWSRDGRTLFFLGPSSLMATAVTSGASFTHETPQALFSIEGYELNQTTRRMYDAAPDGQRFVFVRPTTTDARPDVHVVTNWVEELKRRVPTE